MWRSGDHTANAPGDRPHNQHDMTDHDPDTIDRAIDNVDPERLRADVETNAEFGRITTDAGRGRTVFPGTEANRAARERLLERFDDAGLETRVDSVGNIVGRYAPAGVDADGPAVAAGSHLDSVPRGGIFDGPLGVYGALEAVRAIDGADLAIERPIEVVSFTEEEGHRFTDGVLGSSVAAGTMSAARALDTADADGVTLREALEEIGFHGEGTLDAATWDAWFEVHIEQGRTLERAGVPVGVVTDIVGTIRCQVTVEGEADHSGTTSMDERVDALVPAAELVAELESKAIELSAASGNTVATVGDLRVEPGASNVIPGRATLALDIRDTEYANMTAIRDHVESSLARFERERGVETAMEGSYDIEPIGMSERCQRAFRRGAERAGAGSVALHSGAGHDTMQVARATDAGLLFVQSRDGVSHNPKEWTDWDVCAAGVRTLTGAIALAACDERHS